MKNTILSALLTCVIMLAPEASAMTGEYRSEVEDFLSHDDQYLLRQNLPDPVPLNIREHWMRRAKDALLELTGTPCPFAAFGTAIVNHTTLANDGFGELVCIGANQAGQVGNPTLHGEIAAINNCTKVLASPPYNLSPAEIYTAWKDLSLYTTAEACTMCTSAISWGGFREYIYATTIWTLIDLGWQQIPITSRELLSRSPMAKGIRIVGPVLEQETDPLFRWQFKNESCPAGCERNQEGGCVYHS